MMDLNEFVLSVGFQLGPERMNVAVDSDFYKGAMFVLASLKTLEESAEDRGKADMEGL